MTRIALSAPLALIIALGATAPAHAYLDPGTGSILIQSLIGSIAAAATIGGLYLGLIRSFFGRLFGKSAAARDAHRE